MGVGVAVALGAVVGVGAAVVLGAVVGVGAAVARGAVVGVGVASSPHASINKVSKTIVGSKPCIHRCFT